MQSERNDGLRLSDLGEEAYTEKPVILRITLFFYLAKASCTHGLLPKDFVWRGMTACGRRTLVGRLTQKKLQSFGLHRFLFKPSTHASMALGLNKKTGFQPVFSV